MGKMTDLARDRQCELRLDGCLLGNETVVFAHLNGAGMGRKNSVGGFDWGCPACFNCHNIVDGRVPHSYEKGWLDEVHKNATIRFQQTLAREGRIFVVTRKKL
jgi:hypothetical protein